MLLGLDPEKDEVIDLANQLIKGGLAEQLPYGYLRLQPALGPALLSQLSERQREAARSAWAEAMEQLALSLYQQKFKDPTLAATLTLLELPNLLAVLEYLRMTASADRVVRLATRIEDLVKDLGQPRALAQAKNVRVATMRQLGEWSHTRFEAERAAIERLFDAGRHADAVAAAQALLTRAEAAGVDAYDWASYDLALCHFLLGQGLRKGGAAKAALAPLDEARKRFQRLADAGDAASANAAFKMVTARAACLGELGRLDEAAETYEEAIAKAKELNDPRAVAVNSRNLIAVRIQQGENDEALALYTEAQKLSRPSVSRASLPTCGVVLVVSTMKPGSTRPPNRSIWKR